MAPSAKNSTSSTHQSTAGRAGRLRFAALCGAALIGLGGIYFGAGSTGIFADGNAARVVRLLGKARVKPAKNGGDWRPLEVGAKVSDGDLIETGANSQMILRYRSIEMRLGPNTKTRVDALVSPRKSTKIHVASGYSWFNVKKGKVKGPVNFTVTTPTAIASVRGTKFAVTENADGSLACVCEGKVDTAPAAAKAATAGGKRTSRALTGDSHSFGPDGKSPDKKDFAKYFRGLKVDHSFQKKIVADERLSYCTSCHRMTDLATDNSADPEEY